MNPLKTSAPWRPAVIKLCSTKPRPRRQNAPSIVLGFGALIVAPVATDDRVCFDKNSLPDAQIAACSRLLSMGKFRGSNLAHIYGWRGNSSVGKGE
jgi:hypothetical protein